VPARKYLERLDTRNEFFITSHHPLRETLMAQTGDSRENSTLERRRTTSLEAGESHKCSNKRRSASGKIWPDHAPT
jgi:hypothetical protein